MQLRTLANRVKKWLGDFCHIYPRRRLGCAAAQNVFVRLESLGQRGQLSLHGITRGWERAPMKQRIAREQILGEWDRWIRSQKIEPGGPTGKESLKFFIELQDAKSPLLDFPSRGRDRWRIIHAWLLTAQRVHDHWFVSAPPIVPNRRPRAARQKTGCKT